MDRKTMSAKTLSVLLAIFVWQLAADAVGMEMLLASPFKVMVRLWQLLFEKSFWLTVFFSTLRVMAGFLSAFAAGILLALAAGRFRFVENLLWPWVVTVKSVPVASFIILCLIWFSYTGLTVFIAFLIAFPVIYGNVLQGMKSTDPGLSELAKVYRVSGARRFLYITLPSVKPYLLSASRIAIGMAWKAGVAAEVIGMVEGSIGERLYDAKIYFLNAELLAWTLVIILLSVVLEKLFSLLLAGLFRLEEKL